MADILLTVGVDTSLSFAEFQSGITSLVSQINGNPPKIKVKFDDASISEMRQQIEALNKAAASSGGKGSMKFDTSGVSGSTAAVNANTQAKKANADASKKAASAAKEAASSEANFVAGTKKHTDALNKVNALLGQVTANTNKWTAAANGKSNISYESLKSQIGELQTLRNGLIDGSISAKQFDDSFSRIKSTVTESSAAIRAAGENTQSFGDRIGGLANKFATWFGITRIIMTTVRTCKQMVSASMEIENSMAQLKIVTGASDSQMEAFLTKSTGLAKELGKSITDVSSSIETFSRLGYGLEDASELAKYANILSNVAKVDVDTATTGMTSIIKGYNMDVSQAEHVSDVLVKVGQEYAISAEELMAAFQRGGAALYASGTDFEKSAALFAATNASLQNAEAVGTMWKTVSARIRGATTELEEMGEETDGLADGLSKYREEIMALSGVDIMKDENTYKDMYDIFVELAQVWDNIKSDEARSRVAEILGGTRQLSGIMSTITNIRDAMGAYESAMDSAGAATQANDIYMSTASAHVEQLKTAFQELSASLIDTGFITTIVDFGTNILHIFTGITQVINALGGLKSVLIAVSGIVLAMKLNSIKGMFVSMGSSIISFTGKIKELPSALKIAKSEGEGLSSALDLVGISASAAQIAIGAITAAVTLAVAAYSKYHQNLRDTAQAELDKANSAQESYEAFENAYIIASQYAEKTELSASENENLKSAIDGASTALGIEAGAFDTATGSAQAYLDKLKEISQEQLDQNLSDANKGEKAARELLSDTADPHWLGMSVSGSKATIAINEQMTGIESHVAALEYVNKLMSDYIDMGTYGQEIEPINFDSLEYGTQEYADAIVDYYYALKDVQNAMANDELAIESDLYSTITSTISTLSTDTEAYVEAKKEQLVAEYEAANGIPTTAAEYKKMQDTILDNIEYTEEYENVLSALMFNDFSDSIDNLANGLAELEGVNNAVAGSATDAASIYAQASSYITQSAKEATESAQNLISGINAAQETISGQQNGKSISIADFNSDELKDYRSALEYVNGTMQLNADKVKEIAQAKADEQVAINNTNKALEQAKYLENAKQIEEYRQKLRDASYAEGESKESVLNSIDALLAENNAIADTCAQYDLLSASIQEAVGAYQHWLNAQSASDYGDMANDAVSAVQRIRDTYDQNSDIYGNFGSKKFEAAIDFIVPDSVDGEDLSAVEAYMSDFKQYLTFDKNGAVDGLNIDKFLENSVEAGLMSYSDDEGFKVLGGKKMEDFAEGLNLSSGMVQSFFDELQLKGAKFDWSDEAVKTIGDLAVEANQAAESLRGLEGNENLKIKMDVSDLATADEQVAALDATIAEMDGIKAKPGVDSSEIDNANAVIQYCLTQKQLLTQPDVMRVDTSQVEGDIGNAISLLQQFQQAQNELEINSKVGADTSEAETKISSLTTEIQGLSPTIKANLDLDTTSTESIKTSIAGLSAETINVKANVDASAITGYNPETKSCDVIYNPKTDALPTSFDSINRTVNYVPVTSSLPSSFSTITRYVKYVKTGDVSVNGTAHASGTARAGGDWGTAPGGTTLVGELGREIVVDPRTGQWYTVGDTGAEFRDIPAGAIVFNHKQTESLLANGYVAGRASALVSGTALVTGGYKPYKPSSSSTTRKPSSKSSSSSSSGKSSSNKSNSSKEKDDNEVIDWIEIAIDRIERAIDRLATKATSPFKTLATRLQATNDELVKMSEELTLQQNAYNRYIQQANSVGVSSDIKAKVQNGTLDITEYDGDTAEKIKEYQDWYEKALDCKDAIDELNESIAELYQNKFSDTATDFENQLSLLEHLTNTYNNGIDELEERGYLATTKYYQAMQDVEKQNIDIRKKELDALIKRMSEGVNSGSIKEGSEAWYEMQQEINAVKESIQESETAVISLNNSIRETEWGHFDYLQEQIGSITKEADFLIDLMEDSKLFTDNGQLTDTGMATMGLHGQNYNVYMAQADKYAEEIKELNKEIANDPNNTKLLERREELLEAQRDSIIAANDEKQAIRDLVEEGIEKELDSLEKLISQYTDALDSAKDMYDYQKKVKNQTSEIAKLQKQISAYSGDTSEENRATVQKLEVNLAKAMEDLEETQYEHYISDQKKLLDNLYNEYEMILNQRLDNIDALMSDMIDSINMNSSSICDTLMTEAGKVGYTITENQKAIWANEGGAFTIISKYGESFLTQMTTVNDVISKIAIKIGAMVSESDKKAETTVKNTTPSTKADPTVKPPTTTTPSKTPAKTQTESKPKFNDDIKRGIAAAIWVYGGSKSGWGNDPDRKKRLTAKFGATNASAVQKYINAHGSNGDLYKYWVSTGKSKLSKYYYSAFKTGGLADYTGMAWLDGTPTEPELVLNAEDTKNFIALKDALRSVADGTSPLANIFGGNSADEIISNIGHIDTPTGARQTTNIGDITYEVNIPIDHVSDYNDFMNQMRKDGKFEKMIQSMTVDRLVGGSKLSKNKFQW